VLCSAFKKLALKFYLLIRRSFQGWLLLFALIQSIVVSVDGKDEAMKNQFELRRKAWRIANSAPNPRKAQVVGSGTG
jgi:hypothetical protein